MTRNRKLSYILGTQQNVATNKMKQTRQTISFCYCHHFLMLVSVALLLLLMVTTNVRATDDADDESTTIRPPIVIDSDETEEDAIARQSTNLCINFVGCNCDEEFKEATCNCPNSNPVNSFFKFNFILTLA